MGYLAQLIKMNRNRWLGKVLGGFIIAVSSYNLSAAEGDILVAGVHPDQRPANAPVIAQLQKDRAWYDNALRGVIPPFPPSLRFVEDQGNWYTPFTRPGMVSRYDIRGWHQPKLPY